MNEREKLIDSMNKIVDDIYEKEKCINKEDYQILHDCLESDILDRDQILESISMHTLKIKERF